MIMLLMASVPVQPSRTPHSHLPPLGLTLSMTSGAVIWPQVQDVCHLYNHMPTLRRHVTADSASRPVTCLQRILPNIHLPCTPGKQFQL